LVKGTGNPVFVEFYLFCIVGIDIPELTEFVKLDKFDIEVLSLDKYTKLFTVLLEKFEFIVFYKFYDVEVVNKGLTLIFV